MVEGGDVVWGAGQDGVGTIIDGTHSLAGESSN